MKTLMAFMKKEWMEQIRSSRLMILGLIFLAFGIMNPAIAKITPWIMEMLAETMEESGLAVVEVKVDAMTSWTQFYKNVPMALIAFVLLQSNIFTKEYQSGTLILALTKGLERYKVVLAKTIVLISTWTAGYWLCYGVTYAYNAYFWDNSIASHLGMAALYWWLIGIWVIALMILFSVMSSSNSGVLLGTGGVFFAVYLLSLIPKLKEYMPTQLMDGMNLLMKATEPGEYTKSLIVAGLTMMVCFIISIPLFNKRRL
ncbi:MAG: ABC transporter permease subunit [Lachnospiraceae bacterium]|nr:ABC transporter permease subunit [Lachnospiraceae bacterium]MBP3352637.1 ABC transporter permease subunit [Lachnospiraceae bacterium]